HGHGDSQTIEFRKSRLDVVSYQAALESVESTLVVYKQNESIFQDNIIVLTNELSPAKPAEDLSHTNRPFAPIIEECVSDSKDDYKTTAPQIAHSFVQSTKQVTPPRHSVQPVEAPIPAATPKPTSPKTSSSVLPKFKSVSVTAVRPICADVPKIMMTRPRHAHSLNTRSNSTIQRHKTCSHSSNTSNSSPKVTVSKAPLISATKGKKGKWVWRPKCPILDHDSRTTGEESIIRDPEEESSEKTPTETKSKDKGKGILVEEPKPIKKKQQVKMDEDHELAARLRAEEQR
nr:hypothetical protein [Tanacetum cinerariifolium]